VSSRGVLQGGLPPHFIYLSKTLFTHIVEGGFTNSPFRLFKMATVKMFENAHCEKVSILQEEISPFFESILELPCPITLLKI
jgi:hypothetical protein